ncbi:MAG TPA: M56 family metallopeptidase [Holophagaceae bacterium]
MNPVLLNLALQRLGLTIFHALWEDALIGLAAWAGLALLRNAGPRIRYRWACLGLAAMVLAPALTFAALGPAEPLQGVAIAIQLPGVPAAGGTGFGPLRLETSLPWIALVWMLGTALMLLRLGGGLWWLDRRYLAQARPAPAAWEASLRDLARRMGLPRTVRLLASDRAASPLALGWLKPVVLVPASAFLALPPDALEAVLAHELAHLRRGDYLANLLQTLAEALLFFHPAAWWLSRQIREAREHCCDDDAAALLGDPLPLAQGLAALAALRRPLPSDPDPALAAARGNLMSRITRLFQPRPEPVPSLRGLALLLAGAALLGTTALGARAMPKPAPRAASDRPVLRSWDAVKVRFQPDPPAYPPDAKEKRIQGTVIVELVIDENGIPIRARATKGPQALRGTAVAYALGWRFEPVLVDGKPVPARFHLTMPFRLR